MISHMRNVILLCIFITLHYNSKICATTIRKCSDFQQTLHGESSNAEESQRESIIIPSHLMSDFQSTKFRLDTQSSFACEKNYEVIKISLFGSNNAKINSTDYVPNFHNQGEQDEFSSNSTINPSSKVYEPFYKTGNSSYSEGFMYSIENITAIPDSVSSTVSYNYEVPQCDRKLSRQEIQFTPLGFLFYDGGYYRTTEYCIHTFNEVEGWMIIKRCKIDCNDENTPCIPLCCHIHEFVDLAVPCCQTPLESKNMFQPMIYEDINRKLSLEETIVLSDNTSSITHSDTYAPSSFPSLYNSSDGKVKPHYVSFKYHHACPDGLEPERLFFNDNGDSVINTRVYVLKNGKIAYIGDDRQWHFLEIYCVAGLVNEDFFQDEINGIGEMTTIIQYCLDSNDRMPNDARWRYYVFIGTLSFSSVFLLLTVIVYILLWDKHNIHGWTILSFVASEFLWFVFITVSYTLGVFTPGDEISKTAYCVGSGILAHFFFLSTFCWLSIINLDLWWTFKSLTPLSERSKGRRRFCLYMLFAWGIPSAVVSIGLILQQIYKYEKAQNSKTNLTNIVVPDYGHRECFLASRARGVYLYDIIGVLLVINFIFITMTFITIYKFKKSTQVATTSSSRTKERSFKLIAKLVIVMGVTWSLEFISWVDSNVQRFPWLFLAIDMFNALQAVATFIIFVCKRKIFNQLEQKHPSLKVLTRPIMKLLSRRASALAASTESKQTRSTTVGASSSVLHRSGRKAQEKQVAECKL